MSRPLTLTAMAVTEADVAAVEACYRSGWLTMGPRTQQLEQELAALTGAPHAVAVSSGTAALQLALLASGVGTGDEVLVPALAFPGAAALVAACGATAVACDVTGLLDHTIDPRAAADRIGPATKALVAVHRWGYPCDLPALRALCDAHGLALVQDAAHAILAAGVGGGDLTCYSLSSSKQLAVGEGGVVTTADAQLAATVRSLRSHAMTSGTWDRHRGHADRYDVVALGYNHRIDEPRAALGLSRLARLPGALAARRRLVERYRAALAGAPGVTVPFGADAVARSSHGAFGVLLGGADDRDRAAAALAAAGVETAPMAAMSTGDRPLPPHAAEIVARGLRLPLHERLAPADVDAVCARLTAR